MMGFLHYFLTLVFAIGLWLNCVNATVTNTPHLNGPIFPVVPQSVPGAKRSAGEFVHPGLWHTHSNLETIRNNVLNGVDPWKSAYEQFSIDSYSQANYTMRGPAAVLSRGAISNYTSFTSDVRAAYQNALMWYITKDQAHWNRSTTILDAWGSGLVDIIGTDASLLVGLEGDMFANAAEIMRWEGGWVESGSKWQGGSGFSIQLYWLFARQSVINGQANYGMVSVKALLSFAVYLDDITMYNYALYLMYNDLCAGIYGNYDSATAQPLEAGRDQGHVQSGLSWTANAAKVIQNQGSGDLFRFDNNLLLRAAEYTAKFNLNNTVPYNPKIYRCEAVLVDGPWPVISTANQGMKLPVWDIIYYEYVIKRGLSAPYTTEARAVYGFEGSLSNNDGYTSWGDLIWATSRG